jgi:hypothetical protein
MIVRSAVKLGKDMADPHTSHSKIKRLSRHQQLNADDGFDVGYDAPGMQACVHAHADVVLLIATGRNGVHAVGMGESLALRDQGGCHVLRDHESAVQSHDVTVNEHVGEISVESAFIETEQSAFGDYQIGALTARPVAASGAPPGADPPVEALCSMTELSASVRHPHAGAVVAAARGRRSPTRSPGPGPRWRRSAR